MEAKVETLFNHTNHIMGAKIDILSKETIKPSSPTPPNLRHFKLSFLDQLSPDYYVPILHFYSASDVTSFSSLSTKLKSSLSNVLSLYYPFCGRVKNNAYIECNDAGVLYIEARVPFCLSEILDDPEPQVHVLKQLLPFSPYELRPEDDDDRVNLAIQVTEFGCGSIGLAVIISHRIADGTTLASFLSAWAATARGSAINVTKPYMEAALLFPTGDIDFTMPGFDEKDVVTRRLMFDKSSLCKLRDDIKAKKIGYNPTRVEAVTALIWKLALEATRDHTLGASVVSHVVDIRNRMVPQLPKHSTGNLYQYTTSPLVELGTNKRMELQDLALLVRTTIRKVDPNYVSELEGVGGLDMAMESFGKIICTLFEISEGVQGYVFSSWARFPFYECDFGWGKPIWVCTVGPPARNVVFLLPTRCGEGIEAWVNLTKQDMLEFECNPELLQYASLA